MFRAFTLLALALVALPASAQWERIETYMPISDLYAVNLVGADAEYTYATVLAGRPVPNRFEIVRSADDGASWQVVFTGYNGAARGAFLGDLGGQMAVLIQGTGVTGLLLSNDRGRTWAETSARLPTSQITSVARDGQTYVATGGNTSYRSTDGGASWMALELRAMAGVVHFNGAFHALNSIGQLYRLNGAAWTAVPFGSPFATNLWIEGGQLWVKASAGSLYSSPDGTAWSAKATAAPSTWGRVIAAPDDETPWFLHNQAAALDLLLSDDNGATATSIADGYPRDDNGNICISNYAVSTNAVIGNAWACSFTGPERNGVFRYVFGTRVPIGPLVPVFGFAGRVTVPLALGLEYGISILPDGGSRLVGGGGMRLVGSSGSIARLLSDGSLDSSFGADGVVRPRASSAISALPVADGALVLAGVGGAWRVLENGTLDASYGTAGVANRQAFGAAAFADGSVILHGFYDPTGGTNRKNGVVKLTASGVLDTAFGTNGFVFPDGRTGTAGIAVDGDGRTLALFNNGASDPTFVYRYTASGVLDASFGSGGIASFPDDYRGANLATDASGRVYFTSPADFGNGAVRVIRLTPAGALDASFASGGRAEIPGTDTDDAGTNLKHPSLRTLRVAANGFITAGGVIGLTFPVNDGVLGFQNAYLARLTTEGAMDTSFGDGGQFFTQWSGRFDQILDVAIDADNTILATGRSDTGFGQQDERAFVLRAFPDVTSGGNTASEDGPERGLGLTIWPNPTRGSATVRVRTEAAGPVSIDVFDTLGRLVARLGNEERPAGEWSVGVPSGLAPGAYVIRAMIDGRLVSRMLTIAR